MDLKLKIFLLALGAACIVIGYFSFFKKEFFLTRPKGYYSNFNYDNLSDEKKVLSDKYARRGGLFCFVFGIVVLLGGIAVCIFL